jgi:hypothetical protein
MLSSKSLCAAEGTPEQMSAALTTDIIFGGAEYNKFVSQVGLIGPHFQVAFPASEQHIQSRSRIECSFEPRTDVECEIKYRMYR